MTTDNQNLQTAAEESFSADDSGANQNLGTDVRNAASDTSGSKWVFFVALPD